MTILIIGSGQIASHVASYAHKIGKRCSIIPLRKFTLGALQNGEILSDVTDILYAGYDPYDMFKNIFKMIFVEQTLRKFKYSGNIFFLNTQDTILEQISCAKFCSFDKMFFNKYVFVKNCQSRIIRRSPLMWREIFLPFVIGEGTRYEKIFSSMKSNSIPIPFEGSLRLYTLEITRFAQYICENRRRSRTPGLESVFLYSDYWTLSEMIENKHKFRSMYEPYTYSNAYNLAPLSLLRWVAINAVRSYLGPIIEPLRPRRNPLQENGTPTCNRNLPAGLLKVLSRDFHEPDYLVQEMNGMRISCL